jgi:hypothetical protein
MDGGREQAFALMAVLMGAVMLARMSATRQSRDQVISAGRAAAFDFLHVDIA